MIAVSEETPADNCGESDEIGEPVSKDGSFFWVVAKPWPLRVKEARGAAGEDIRGDSEAREAPC